MNMKYYDLVTIQIVLYEEKKDLVFNCLKGLKNFKINILDNSNNLKLKNEINKNYQVDNYLLEKKNIGFSNGHNKLAQFVKTKYLFILNADCIMEEKNILKLLDCFEIYKNVGIASPTTFDYNMKNITYNGGLLPEYGKKNITTEISGDTCFQSVLGSAMMIKKKDFDEVGMFNKNLFLFFSDDDLCRKFRSRKKLIIQIKNSTASHIHGQSKVKNLIKKIFLREYHMTYDELYYYYITNNHLLIFSKLKKKFSKYLFKIILNFCILNFKKMLLYLARVLAFIKFYSLNEKKWD
jgi:GT2 family glycosyltransferase